MLVKINSFHQYEQLVDQYSRKGRLTNDYLQNEAADLIIHNQLFSVEGNDNAFLFVQKEGFYRMYYYINNTAEQLLLPNEELVTEILFRGDNTPEDEVKFLENMGFSLHLVRDQYFAKYSSLNHSAFNEGLKIDIASNEDDVIWAIHLFNSSFDKWSGDYISEAKAKLLILENAILIAKDKNGNRLGALHFEIRQGVCWLNHVAVLAEARGHKVGQGLLESYIEQGHKDSESRYMLWVQRVNSVAVNMYRNKGFVPMNKSTLSMIRL